MLAWWTAGIAMHIRTWGRRAQVSGTGAAVLVLIIAALIILYILFLPPEVREEILEGKEALRPGAPSGQEVFLLESPGRLDAVGQRVIEHSMPSIQLYSTTNAQLLHTVPSLYVKNGWFDKIEENVTFRVPDPALTSNVIFAFNTRVHEGRLRIKFGGETVFDDMVTTLNVEPILLPDEMLQESNTLTFSVGDVGWKFWHTNEFVIEDLTITGDVTDISTQQSKVVFLATATEKNNLEKASVRFFSDCDPDDVGILDVYLNGHNIFSSVPDCGTIRATEVSPTLLVSGENTLSFRTSKGAYLIDHISVTSELKEISNPTYYFEIQPAIFDEVVSGRAHLGLYFEFSNDIDQKRADIYVNGNPRAMDTRDRIWRLGIDPFINEGNNVIEIRPRSTLDIVNMRVALD